MTADLEAASCRGMGDLFYSEDYNDQQAAKQVCQQCGLLAPCLTTALNNREPHGVWGGLTAPERGRLLNGLTPVVPHGRPRSVAVRSTRLCSARNCEHPDCAEAARAYQRDYYRRVRRFTRIGAEPPAEASAS